jgi:hypothetical protein
MVDGGLIHSVQDVCDQTRTSARLVQHSNGKVYAFDCHQWSMKAASLFRFQQPNAIVCVEQSVASLSGFVLIIEEKRAKYASSRIFVALIATMFVYAALWILYAHTAAGGAGDLAAKNLWPWWSLLNFSAGSIFNESLYYLSNKTNSNNSFHKSPSGGVDSEHCIGRGGSRVDGNGNICKTRK